MPQLKTPTQPTLITTTEALSSWCQQNSDVQLLGIDTEFMRVRTFFPQPSLIQISTTDDTILIDPLVVDCAPLAPLLSSDAVYKVLHSADQDIEVLQQVCPQAKLTRLYDTQIAAALCGYGRQIGLAALVRMLFTTEMARIPERFDWLQRPLPDFALQYASEDSYYLILLYKKLKQECAKHSFDGIVEEESAAILTKMAQRALPQNAWRNMPGCSELKPEQQSVLAELCTWREQLAQKQNCPRLWITSNKSILEIAMKMPSSAAALAALRVLAPKTLQTHGEHIVSLIGKGRKRFRDGEFSNPIMHLNGRQRARVGRWRKRLERVSLASGIDKSVLFDKNDLRALVLEQPSRFDRGWRKLVLEHYFMPDISDEQFQQEYTQTNDSGIRDLIIHYLQQHNAFLAQGASGDLYRLLITDVERGLLTYVMQYTNGNQTLAAQLLGISRTTLSRKLADITPHLLETVKSTV